MTTPEIYNKMDDTSLRHTFTQTLQEVCEATGRAFKDAVGVFEMISDAVFDRHEGFRKDCAQEITRHSEMLGLSERVLPEEAAKWQRILSDKKHSYVGG